MHSAGGFKLKQPVVHSHTTGWCQDKYLVRAVQPYKYQ